MTPPTERASEGTPQVNFRAGELLPDLQVRAGADGRIALTASRDLARYYALLKLALTKLTFTPGEASLIVDAMNGTLTEPHTASLLWANVSDSLEDGLAGKWSVDGAALVTKLRALTPFEALAVADAAERWWNRASAGIDETFDERSRAVGLLR